MANLSKPKCIIHLYCYGVRDELVNTCMGSLQTKCFRPCIWMIFWGIRQFIFGSRIFPICIAFNWWLFFNVTLVDLSLLVCVTDRSVLTVPFFFFNWDSPHARLNSHYEEWSYKKKSPLNTENLFRKNLQLKDVC